MLFDFEIPETIKLGATDNDELANGPFVIERQGIPTLGVSLLRNGDIVMFWDGGRSYYLDETFVVKLVGDKILASSSQYSANWVFRGVTMDDLEWIKSSIPNLETPKNLDALTDTLGELLNNDR